jgi:hypothetical protein
MPTTSTYPHRTDCPAYGVPLWAHVQWCGPCEYLSRKDTTSSEEK